MNKDQDIDTHCKYVGKGWQPIVRETHKKLLEFNPNYEIHQVKEKFGGLRYYTSETCDESRKIIAAAEMKCSITCEECGSTGDDVKTGGTSWLKTLCLPCRLVRPI